MQVISSELQDLIQDIKRVMNKKGLAFMRTDFHNCISLRFRDSKGKLNGLLSQLEHMGIKNHIEYQFVKTKACLEFKEEVYRINTK